MRRFVLLALITATTLTGCTTQGAAESTVIGGSDGPTTIYLVPKVDNEEVKDGSDEFLAGTWSTASQGYEYYGKAQAEYYVRFEGTDIIYGHMKDGFPGMI